MSERAPLGLFDAYGVELEYMLVDRRTLAVRPVADKLLRSMSGQITCDVQRGPISWSNELALHVLELKSTDPAPDLRRLSPWLEQAVKEIEPHLADHGVCLLPTAMHPWMDPARETQLWPHEYAPIYQAYHRIFDCRRHGWANVQSVHLNLPFADEDQFAALHAATRLVLPLMPALAASSPICGGAYSGWADTRMRMYRDHCQRVPMMVADVIPEPVWDRATYQQQIFDPIGRAIRPLDPAGVLQEEFLNARGAIARFERGSIEIRVMDVQEYPAADVAICAATAALLRALVQQRWATLGQQQAFDTIELSALLEKTSRNGDDAVIDHQPWLEMFGLKPRRWKAGEIWEQLAEQLRRDEPQLDDLFGPLEVIFQHGSLSRRIGRALGPAFSPADLHDVFSELAQCLRQWQPFIP